MQKTLISPEQFFAWLGATSINKDSFNEKNYTNDGIVIVFKEYDDKGGQNITDIFLKGRIISLNDDLTMNVLLFDNNNYPKNDQEVVVRRGQLVNSQDLNRYRYFGVPK